MTTKSTLEIATRGACYGHRCDACSICEGGVCCGKEVAPDELPVMGELPLIAGDYGVPLIEEDRIECHLCGRMMESVGPHLVLVHGVNANEYRALVGLDRTTPLASKRYSEHRRRHCQDEETAKRLIPGGTLTREQKSVWARQQGRRLETRIRATQRTCADCGVAFTCAVDGRPQRCPPCAARRIVERSRKPGNVASTKTYAITCQRCGATEDRASAKAQYCTACVRVRAAEKLQVRRIKGTLPPSQRPRLPRAEEMLPHVQEPVRVTCRDCGRVEERRDFALYCANCVQIRQRAANRLSAYRRESLAVAAQGDCLPGRGRAHRRRFGAAGTDTMYRGVCVHCGDVQVIPPPDESGDFRKRRGGALGG